MGKGKGSISHWVAQINCGNVLFEICGSQSTNIISILKNAGSKFPIKTKIIYLFVKRQITKKWINSPKKIYCFVYSFCINM
jgi:ribosomal protein L16/L10AE